MSEIAKAATEHGHGNEESLDQALTEGANILDSSVIGEGGKEVGKALGVLGDAMPNLAKTAVALDKDKEAPSNISDSSSGSSSHSSGHGGGGHASH